MRNKSIQNRPCELPKLPNRVRMLEKCTIPRQKIKKIPGRGRPRLPRPLPYWGGGHALPNPTPSAPRHSRLRRSTCAPTRKSWIRPWASSYVPAKLSLSLIHNILGLPTGMFINATTRQQISIYSIGPYWYLVFRSLRSRILFCTPTLKSVAPPMHDSELWRLTILNC